MTINLDKDFYKLSAIKGAIRAYKGLADFKIGRDKKNYKITIQKINPGLGDVIGDEFLNYVLAEMKNG